jgi:hypothetical protein
MIKKTLISLAVLVLFGTGICHASGLQLRTGLNFDWWKDNKGGTASQLVTPISVYGQYQDLSIRFLTAFASTELKRNDLKTRISDFVDSKLGISYLVSGKLPVDIMLGLDFNLPTGKTNLNKRQAELVLDPDLFTINNFGEGFNINPTLTIAKDLQNWIIAAGFGYLWRGEYDFSTDQGMTGYKPGEVYNTTAEVRYYFTNDTYTRLFGSYSWYGKDTLNKADFFKEGNVGLLGGEFYFRQNNSWDASLTFRSIFRDSVNSQALVGVLAKENGNLHGDEYVIDLNNRYFLNDKTTLSIPLQYRIITANNYAAGTPKFIGEKDKISFGIGISRVFSPAITAEVSAKGFLKHDNPNLLLNATESVSYSGYSLTANVTGRF